MPQLFASPLAIVDVETTGMSYKHGGVIDIGVLRIEDGTVVGTCKQLVDPGSALPAFITNLTGITNDDLKTAPGFSGIADDLWELLDGCIFIAHNVRFDYAFIKEEFARCGRKYAPKQLCTVRLSRALYPQFSKHSLDALINRFGLAVDERHRAFADAEATWQALQIMAGQTDPQVFDASVAQQLRRPSLPRHIAPETVRDLPSGPGVYVFKSDTGAPLYVGKSVHIKQRVLSHFADDHRSAKEMQLTQQTVDIATISTTGELGALLTESAMVKDLLPMYNRQLRRKSELVTACVVQNADGYPTVVVSRRSGLEPAHISSVVALYTSVRQAKESLVELAKQHHLCHKWLGLEKTRGACFACQLGHCYGACLGKESALAYTARFDAAFATTRLEQWPYRSAIAITEADPESDVSTCYIVDHWSVIGVVSTHDQSSDVSRHNALFDLDQYKILKRYLQNPHNRPHIRTLSAEELTQLQTATETEWVE